MRVEQMGEVLAEFLTEQEMMLGTIECGVDGLVSHRFFDLPGGPDVLGSSLTMQDVSEVVGVMDLPRPQFKKQGDFSAKAARAAAREGGRFLGVEVCLVVWARGPTLAESLDHPIYLALAVGGDVVAERTVEATNDGELVSQAFELLAA